MPTKPNRRKFIKQSALAGIGFFSGVPPRAFSNSPNEKVNLGMIGCAGKGETNVMAFSSAGQNIIALCDVDTERPALAFKMRPKATRYTDYREMLEKQKDIDAVVVTTPDHSHARAAITAMKLGKHVYVEKPMAHTIYESRLLQKVAAETKVATQMGNQGHAGWVLREAVEIVESGAIGNVTEFHAWTDRPSWPQALDRPTEAMPIPPSLNWDLWLGPAPERPYHECYLPRKWRGWWDFGTGPLGDMACHITDLGFWALDLGYPIAVEAEVSDHHLETGPQWSIIRYDFPARGSQPPVRLTWYDGGKKPDPALADGEEIPGNGSLLIGDKGKLFVPETYGAKYVLLPRENFADYKTPAIKYSRPKSHYMEWIEACKGNGPSMSNFIDYAGKLTEVVLVGNVALRVGKKIEWDGPNMKATNCPEADPFIKPEYRDGWGIL